jgi:hypothetical protein
MERLKLTWGLVFLLAGAGSAALAAHSSAQRPVGIDWHFQVGSSRGSRVVVVGHEVPIGDDAGPMAMPPGSAWSCETGPVLRDEDGGETRFLRCTHDDVAVQILAGCIPDHWDDVQPLQLYGPNAEWSRVGLDCRRSRR